MVISVELADQIHPCDTMPINLIGEAERAVGHNPSLARTGVYGAGVFPSALVTKQQAYQRFERTAARIDPELILLVRVSGEAMPDPRPSLVRHLGEGQNVQDCSSRPGRWRRWSAPGRLWSGSLMSDLDVIAGHCVQPTLSPATGPCPTV
jgi:hypothetical protein